MAKGEEATKRLADADKSLGMQAKKKPVSRDVGEPVRQTATAPVPQLQAGLDEALTDEVIANQQLAQAARMRIEAKSLLAEADRLESDSAKLAPSVVKAKAKVKTGAEKITEASTEVVAKRKPGRPKATKNDPQKA